MKHTTTYKQRILSFMLCAVICVTSLFNPMIAYADTEDNSNTTNSPPQINNNQSSDDLKDYNLDDTDNILYKWDISEKQNNTVYATLFKDGTLVFDGNGTDYAMDFDYIATYGSVDYPGFTTDSKVYTRQINNNASYLDASQTIYSNWLKNKVMPWSYTDIKVKTQKVIATENFKTHSTAYYFFYNSYDTTTGSNCLKSVLWKADTSDILSFYNMFYQCKSLENITFTDFNSINENVNLSCMFWECTSDFKINTNQWHIEKASTTDYMFSKCSALTKLDLSSWDLSNISSTLYMLEGCDALHDFKSPAKTNKQSFYLPASFSLYDSKEKSFTSLNKNYRYSVHLINNKTHKYEKHGDKYICSICGTGYVDKFITAFNGKAYNTKDALYSWDISKQYDLSTMAYLFKDGVLILDSDGENKDIAMNFDYCVYFNTNNYSGNSTINSNSTNYIYCHPTVSKDAMTTYNYYDNWRTNKVIPWSYSDIFKKIKNVYMTDKFKTNSIALYLGNDCGNSFIDSIYIDAALKECSDFDYFLNWEKNVEALYMPHVEIDNSDIYANMLNKTPIHYIEAPIVPSSGELALYYTKNNYYLNCDFNTNPINYIPKSDTHLKICTNLHTFVFKKLYKYCKYCGYREELTDNTYLNINDKSFNISSDNTDILYKWDISENQNDTVHAILYKDGSLLFEGNGTDYAMTFDRFVKEASGSYIPSNNGETTSTYVSYMSINNNPTGTGDSLYANWATSKTVPWSYIDIVDKIKKVYISDDFLSHSYAYYFYNLNYLTSVYADTLKNATDYTKMCYKNRSLTDFYVNDGDFLSATSFESMFDTDYNLENVNVFMWKTRDIQNTRRMFSNNAKVKNLDLSGWNTDNLIKCDYMFSYIYDEINKLNLGKNPTLTTTQINLDNWNVSNVNSFSNMFNCFGKYTNISTKNWDVSNATDFSYMFTYYNGEKLDTANWNTSNVTNMRSMFEGCSNLKDLSFEGWNTSKVTDFSSFLNSTAIENLDISNINTSSATTLSLMFYQCKDIENIDVSHFDTSNVTSISMMFSGCKKLKELDLSNWDLRKCTSSSNAFYETDNLKTIRSPKYTNTENKLLFDSQYWYDMSDLSNHGEVNPLNYIKYFELGATESKKYDCPDYFWNVTSSNTTTKQLAILFSDGTLVLGGDKNYNAMDFKYCIGRMSGDMPGTSSQTVHMLYSVLKSYRDKNYSKMNSEYKYWQESKIIPWSYTDILLSIKHVYIKDGYNTTSFAGYFDCSEKGSNIEDIHFETDFSNINYLSNTFAGCNKLKNVDISRINTDNVYSYRGMFDGCSSMEHIDTSNINTANASDISYMFSNCTNLLDIDVSHFDLHNIRSMSNVFSYCDKLTDINVNNLNVENVDDFSELFRSCKSLKTIDLSTWNTTDRLNTTDMFKDCDSLHVIKSPNTTIDTIALNTDYKILDGDLSDETYTNIPTNQEKSSVFVNSLHNYNKYYYKYPSGYELKDICSICNHIKEDKVTVSFIDLEKRKDDIATLNISNNNDDLSLSNISFNDGTSDITIPDALWIDKNAVLSLNTILKNNNIQNNIDNIDTITNKYNGNKYIFNKYTIINNDTTVDDTNINTTINVNNPVQIKIDTSNKISYVKSYNKIYNNQEQTIIENDSNNENIYFAELTKEQYDEYLKNNTISDIDNLNFIKASLIKKKDVNTYYFLEKEIINNVDVYVLVKANISLGYMNVNTTPYIAEDDMLEHNLINIDNIKDSISDTDITNYNILYKFLTEEQYNNISEDDYISLKYIKGYPKASDKGNYYFVIKIEADNYHDYYEKATASISEHIHKFTDTIKKYPTCLNKGIISHKCDICNYSYTEDIAVLGHIEGDTIIENRTEPTCTTDGGYDEVIYCTRDVNGCDFSELHRKHITIPKIGHIEDIPKKENIIDATCITKGSYDIVIRCKMCNEIISSEHKETDALGHIEGEPKIENYIAPTHTADGSYETVIYCCREVNGCNFSELSRIKTIIPKSEHNSNSPVIENEINPTCTEKGSYDTVVYCKDCNAELNRQHIITEALGHINGQVKIENYIAPTCDKEGSYDEVIYCDRDIDGCNHSELSREHIIIPQKHHIPDKSYIDNEINATCLTKGGYDLITRCKLCNEVINSIHYDIEALGHINGGEVVENYIEATCDNEGSYDLVIYCDRNSNGCGHSELHRKHIIIPIKSHFKDNGSRENIIDATCLNEGSYDMVYRCIDCNKIIDTKHYIINPLGHIEGNEIVENYIKPTCDKDGGYDLVIYCIRDNNGCGNIELSRKHVVLNKSGHIPNGPIVENMIKSTCLNKGSYDKVVYCCECNKEIERETVITDALGHIEGNIVIENKVEATTTNEGGYDEVIYCIRETNGCNHSELFRHHHIIDKLPIPIIPDEIPTPTPTPTPDPRPIPQPNVPENPNPDVQPDKKPDIIPDKKPDVIPEDKPMPKPNHTPEQQPTPQPTPENVPNDTPTPKPQPEIAPIIPNVVPEITPDIKPTPDKKPISDNKPQSEIVPDDKSNEGIIPNNPDDLNIITDNDDNTKSEKHNKPHKKAKIYPINNKNKADTTKVPIIPIVIGISGLALMSGLFFIILHKRKRKIVGTVIDSNNNVYNISLTGKDNLSTATDNDGSFEFTNLKEDDYLLSISLNNEDIIIYEIDTKSKDNDYIFIPVTVNKNYKVETDIDKKTLIIDVVYSSSNND